MNDVLVATSCVTGRRSSQLSYAPANSLKMTSRSLHSLAVSCTAFHVLRHDKPAISTMPSRLWMFHAGRASERPGLRDLWPTRLLANFWQNGFLRESPEKGKSENNRIFTGDLDGGPGWT